MTSIRPLAISLAAALIFSTVGAAEEGAWTKKVSAGKTVFATFKTSEGDITVKLYSKESPKTVSNFVGLATGEKEWTHPKDGQKSRRPLYNGTTFHRVIPGFMIQGGDPMGSGQGDPGFQIEDEVSNGLSFNKPGLLAMANSGPNTNGCQFFITDSKPEQLNGHYSIFGEVLSGYEVVEKIAHVPRGANDRPNSPVTINAVVLSDKGPKPATVKKPAKVKAAGDAESTSTP